MKLLNLRVFSLVLFIGLILSSCKKDDPVDDIVGSWSFESATFDIMVGSKTLTQYLIEDAGYTASEAQVALVLFEGLLQDSFTGTFQMKSDHTYTSDMGGESDSGTWSLSADRKKLTIDSETDGPLILDVAELTSDILKLQTSEIVEEDLNGDEVPETMDVNIELTFTK